MKTIRETVSFEDYNDPAEYEDWELEITFDDEQMAYRAEFKNGSKVAIEYCDWANNPQEAREWFLENAGQIVGEAEVPYFEI